MKTVIKMIAIAHRTVRKNRFGKTLLNNKRWVAAAALCILFGFMASYSAWFQQSLERRELSEASASGHVAVALTLGVVLGISITLEIIYSSTGNTPQILRRIGRL